MTDAWGEHERWMQVALSEARRAYALDEVPIGAVLVRDGAILASGHNERISHCDPTAHAELVVIRRAATIVKDWRLEGCTLYTTLEPCPMCAGAIVLARIPTVVFGAPDPKAGACGTLFNLTNDARLNHRCQVIGGVLADECGVVLTQFFQEQRAKGKK